MVFNPGVPFFIAFHELDPSRDKRCIFFTQKKARCRNFRAESDIKRAIELHKTINTISGDTVDLDLLQEYVLSTCCRRAKHRDRIEDIDLLIPLALRWQNEILAHAGFNTSVVVLGESIVAPAARTPLATASPSHTTMLIRGIESPFDYRLDALTSPRINKIPSTPVTSSPSFQHGSSKSSATTASEFQQLESCPRYDLRCGETVNSTSTQTKLSSRSPLSEFRPHVANPCRSDSVSSRLLAPLERRDSETGSIYIFDRSSSPGHVKIGWTARSVSGRLESWSTCGYIPNLLFSVSHVPHAQRVETLTHHELIKEWRRERRCKASHCGKSHQEWFEISKARAVQVVSYWADFVKRAQPYDSNGRLKTQWRVVIEMFDRDEEVVTGKKLLDCYERSLAAQSSPIHESKGLKQKPKIEEIDIEHKPDFRQLDRLAKTSVRVDSLLIEDSQGPMKNHYSDMAYCMENRPWWMKLSPTQRHKQRANRPTKV